MLLVDDQPSVRRSIVGLLRSGALPLRDVETAATAEQALAAAARLQPDLVVLDVDLDGQDGLSLIPRLPRASHVLVLSSNADPTLRARARRLGAGAFVDKHASAAVLLASIARLAFPRSKGEVPPAGPGGGSRGCTG